MGNSNSILFYHFKKPLALSLYHTILQYLQHPKTLFLLKYYFFNLSLLFLSNRHFFFRLGFPGLSNNHFFSSLSPSTSSTGSTHKATHTHRPMIHRSTYPNPSPHTHTNTNHQTFNRATHTNHQNSRSQQRPPHPPPKPPISKPTPRI